MEHLVERVKEHNVYLNGDRNGSQARSGPLLSEPEHKEAVAAHLRLVVTPTGDPGQQSRTGVQKGGLGLYICAIQGSLTKLPGAPKSQ